MGKGAAVPNVDATGATDPPTTPLTPGRQENRAPWRQENREALTSEIVGEQATPPKALQLGVVTDARKSVLDTLAAVKQAYDNTAKKNDDDDDDLGNEKPSMMKRPMAETEKRKAGA